ncbi:MAG TPA: hypothetical protein VFH02_13600 [Jiangellaceae bacterium]|nr:hypothetical protein [Jiangellaceae bacterium]
MAEGVAFDESPFRCELPLLDEHGTTIAAGADDVWPVLLRTVDRALSGGTAVCCARAIGCADRTASGPRPLAEGSTMPGFRVVAAVPATELALEGRHRFAAYSLTFRLERVAAGRSRLRAESRAAFPGPTGGAYRLLVVGTGGHVTIVRHWLTTVRRRSERQPATRALLRRADHERGRP